MVLGYNVATAGGGRSRCRATVRLHACAFAKYVLRAV